MKRPVKSGGGVPLYQVKITLKWSKPSIWRRVVVRSDLKLDQLHDVIQVAMGWTDSHMHQFIVGKTFYGQPNTEMAGLAGDTLDERRYTVADLAPAAREKFSYEYDFGDSWRHDVVVEKVLPHDPGSKHPVCLAGANNCPPEDCGGIGGYYNLLEAVDDPKHPQHEDLQEWLAGDFDPAFFDLTETNACLKRLKAWN
jgi:Plasmid pRiA4b ORF-3-like protein